MVVGYGSETRKYESVYEKRLVVQNHLFRHPKRKT